ncbi:ABC transporter permease [Streptomyces sp. JJ36]|uniref:ABC transporter permease n=1 Tax=Streptomyces sp. JJ36 TaxID=2736645 RepID=UPI001F38502B|nr:ABC transporter permease [Streptomyces sp. JJ36]MCF6523575.1 ABC transporter permease [Streptomyces sp. JJ36]
MTTTATPPTTRPAAAARPRGGDALAGTGTLLRFNLRRDRIRIPVWVLALFLGTLSTLSSLKQSYPDAEDRASTAETLDSPAGLAMSGPGRYLDDYNYGSMMGHQMLGFVVVLVGLMSVLMIARHTRAEEETGRAELVRAAVVGRHAHLTAALATAALTNVLLGLLLALGLGGAGGSGITWSGSLLYGAAHTVTGLVFAAVAAVTVQITGHSRGASGMALAVIGVAYALRAAGDVGSGVLSWLSPIGWAQRTYVYVDDRWWPLLLALAFAAALTATAYVLSTRRDVGAGLRATRQGRATATNSLLQPLGFALRLHRGMLFGFCAGLFVMGAMYGSILGDVEDMIEDIAELREAVQQLGGATIAESFASTVMIVLAVVASVHVVLATLRPRAEESAGRAEPLLSTALSRARWVGSHLVVATAGGVLVLAAAGLGFGVLGASATGDEGFLPDLLVGALVYAPALWVTAGAAVALYGWVPRAAPAAWLLPVYAFVVGYLGQLLSFPGWMSNLSPFGHVPQLPAEDLRWTPLLLLTAVAAGLVALGLAGFRRRDLETK